MNPIHLGLVQARLGLLQPRHLASLCVPAAAAALRLWRCHNTHAPTNATCILSDNPPSPLLCGGQGDYPERVWQQLAAFFPDRAVHPPTCIDITVVGTSGASTQHLQAQGFDVRPLALRQAQPGGVIVGGSSRRCCLEEGGSGTPAAAVPQPPPSGAVGQSAAAVETAGTAATAASAASELGQASGQAQGQGQGQGQAQAQGHPPHPCDAVVFGDVMHLLDTRQALQAAHRHLRRQGLLLVLWTDRDLSSDFVLGLEELLEATVPGYCRYSCQRDPSDWVPRLQSGGLFRMIDYSCVAHSHLVHGLPGLMDTLDAQGGLRAALGSSRRRAFHADLKRLVDAHFGPAAAAVAEAAGGEAQGQLHRLHHHHPHRRQWFEVPLHTKAYLLAKTATPTSLLLRSSGSSSGGSGGGSSWAAAAQAQAAAVGLFGPEKVCLFCGSPVAED